MSAFVPSPDEQESVPISPPVPAVAVFPEIVGATGETIGTLDEVGVAVESRLARLKRIGKPVASFFSVQIIVQILMMLSGLLLVRHMSKTEYAFYTVANTMQGTIAVLGDSGIGSAISAIGGVVWQDRRRFGELIQTALEFRRKFGVAIFVIIGPLMYWMLYSNGSGVKYGLLLCAIVLIGASLSLVHGVLVLVPRLHLRVKQLQNAELLLAGLRFVLVALACLIFLNAAVVIIIFTLTLAIQNYLYRRWAALDADLDAPTNDEYRKEIWKMVRYQAPNGIFFCLQSQIFVLMLSFFGKASDVADVGALGRLAVFFSVVTSVMINLVLPKFSRCQDKNQLKKMYIQILTFYLVLSSIFMAIVILFPNSVLLILGDKYENLQSEVIYFAFSSVAVTISGIIHGLNLAKGWLKWSWISIPLIIVTQILMIPLLDLSSIKSLALLSAIPTIIGALPYLYQAYHSIRFFDSNIVSE